MLEQCSDCISIATLFMVRSVQRSLFIFSGHHCPKIIVTSNYGQVRCVISNEFERERSGITKAMFLGDAYLNAYMDVEEGRPKLKLGQVRIRPGKMVKEILSQESAISDEFALIATRKRNYYFYWMLDSIEDRNNYEREFKDHYERLFEGVISVMRSYASHGRSRV